MCAEKTVKGQSLLPYTIALVSAFTVRELFYRTCSFTGDPKSEDKKQNRAIREAMHKWRGDAVTRSLGLSTSSLPLFSSIPFLPYVLSLLFSSHLLTLFFRFHFQTRHFMNYVSDCGRAWLYHDKLKFLCWSIWFKWSSTSENSEIESPLSYLSGLSLCDFRATMLL